jgi:naringenin degradation protein FdeH
MQDCSLARLQSEICGLRYRSGNAMDHQMRRIVTGHDEQGKAVVLFDGAATNVTFRKVGGFISTVLWAADESPPDVSGSTDRADRTVPLAPPPNGTVLRVVDFPPATPERLKDADMAREMGAGVHVPDKKAEPHPFMHRTKTLDFAIILSGEIDMLLDDSTVHVKAGDFVVQQATNHAWVNRGTETCRIAFIMIDAVEPPAWSK